MTGLFNFPLCLADSNIDIILVGPHTRLRHSKIAGVGKRDKKKNKTGLKSQKSMRRKTIVKKEKD